MGAVYTTLTVTREKHFMADRPTLRQDVWSAAFEALGGKGNAHELADQIANKFTQRRRKVTGSFSVPDKTREAIAADLTAGELSFGKIREKHSVGMSTVQRVAEELKSKGIECGRSTTASTPPTSPAKKPGRAKCKPSKSLEPQSS